MRFNYCFHTAVSFCCLFRYWEESAQHIFTYSSKRRSDLYTFSLKCCVCLLHLNCIQEGWTTVSRYSATLVKQQYCRFLHMRSNDYSTTKRFVDSFILSIMSTNRCSPNVKKQTNKTNWSCTFFLFFNHYHVQRKIWVCLVKYTTIQDFLISNIHQGCIYLIKKYSKTENIFTIWNNRFQYV